MEKLTIVAETTDPVLIDDPELSVVFSNHVQLFFQPDHMLMYFTALTPTTPSNAQVFAKVAITTAHAKRLVDAIQLGLKATEKMFEEAAKAKEK